MTQLLGLRLAEILDVLALVVRSLVTNALGLFLAWDHLILVAW